MRLRLVQSLVRILQPPASQDVRLFVAGLMLIQGLGRLGFWAVRIAAADFLPVTGYAILLTILGGCLVITINVRLIPLGRVIAALSALLMATMAWDVGTLGVTLLIEAWSAYALLGEALTSHDY